MNSSRIRLVFVETVGEVDAIRYAVGEQTFETLTEAQKCQRFAYQAVRT